MRKHWKVGMAVVAAVVLMAGLGLAGDRSSTYEVSATAIEACSCPLFCSCYFNKVPTGGHHCQFNNAYRFEKGSHWGDVDLSGAKIWVSGDLGGHFGDGTTEWAVVSFDEAVTDEQKGAIDAWMKKVFQVKWGRVEVREDQISWENTDKEAKASLGSGMAKIHLAKVFDSHGKQSTVTNTGYWWANSNDGFQLAKSTHEFNGKPSYSYEDRNGFVITLHVAGEIEPAVETAPSAK